MNVLLGECICVKTYNANMIYIEHLLYTYSTSCRNSASCTRVSAVLHALVAMTTASFQLWPAQPVTAAPHDKDDEAIPVTSYLCQWKAPRKRKASNMPMSSAVFQKHDHQKQHKQEVSHTEDFDPRPLEFKGIAPSLPPELLDSVHGESLGISVLFDKRYSHETLPVTDASVPGTSLLKKTVAAFKDSLKLPASKLREIEQNTREQKQSPLWFSVRRYRITASRFGEILRRKHDTPPDALVMSILQPRSFTSVATDWGEQNEPLAIEAYTTYQQRQGHHGLTVGPCVFLLNEKYSFLGASPDGVVYDPSNAEQPFGYIEVKCPYSHKDRTPLEASSSPGFCCAAQLHSNGSKALRLRRNHLYFAQVQGQMAVGGRPWCDFVVFTNKGLSVERVAFDDDYWQKTLLPALESFMTIVWALK